MLLFERFYRDGRVPQRFYTCSAARDRKDCSFFQWEGEKVSDVRKMAHKEIVKASRELFLEACERYKNIIHVSDDFLKEQCLFCHSCDLLFLPKEIEKHLSHHYEQAGDLSKPTAIIRPRENEKTQAVSPYIFYTNFMCSPERNGTQCHVRIHGKSCLLIVLHLLCICVFALLDAKKRKRFHTV